jgi:hypothetical protein
LKKHRHSIHLVFRFAALVLAVNYFSFQVELFEEESGKNNPLPSSEVAFTYPQYNWESFDKTNAPQAFVFIVPHAFIFLCLCPAAIGKELPAYLPCLPIRNNSPPGLSPV